MNRAELERQHSLEERHFWFRARRNALAPWLRAAAAEAPPGPWLELGVGGGGNLRAIAGAAPGRALLGVDCSAVALGFGRRRLDALHALGGDAQRLPLRGGSIAVVTALDVLEHVDDDRGAVRELARSLGPGGQLIVTVPAGPELFGDHDRALGHLRRYGPGQLESLLQFGGFEVLEARGFNRLLRGPVGLWRRRAATTERSDVRRLPGPVNAALGAALRLEEHLPEAWRRGPGLSWWIRARRPAGDRSPQRPGNGA